MIRQSAPVKVPWRAERPVSFSRRSSLELTSHSNGALRAGFGLGPHSRAFLDQAEDVVGRCATVREVLLNLLMDPSSPFRAHAIVIDNVVDPRNVPLLDRTAGRRVWTRITVTTTDD